MNLSEYIASIQEKKIAVIGIGVSNTPLIKKLLESGCCVTACDKSSREKLGDTAEELESLGAELHLGEEYLAHLDAGVIFRTPGLRPDMPELLEAQKRGAVLTSEMEVFFQVCPCKILAVTGSDGKTTTTSIVAEILKTAGYTVHLGGNIGTPLLCEADSMGKDDIAVLELSSFQLMTMEQSPDVAVITNLAPNHLDVHKNMDEYINAKKNIFLHQKHQDALVLNMDNALTKAFAGESCCPVIGFSRETVLENGVFLQDGVIYSAQNGVKSPIMEASDIFLPGVHNVENYMAAFAATRGLAPVHVQKEVAMSFTGVEHRIELVRELDGVKYYNDSIASSPSRTIAGLRSFRGKVILIAGGKDKGVPFDELGGEIIKRVKHLVLTGHTAEKIRDAVVCAPEYQGEPDVSVFEDFKDAVLQARARAEPGDVVILSPASTSFDKFKNFAERGRYFKEIVKEMK